TRGRLVAFYAVPDEASQGQDLPQEPRWENLFTEAGMDMGKFTSGASTWTPPMFADIRKAWDGVYPDRPDIPIHIEAGSYRGRPVYFDIKSPWSNPVRSGVSGKPASLSRVIFFSVVVIAIVGSAVLARRNLRLGRGDRTGAFRLSVYVFVITLGAGICGANVFPRSFDVNLIQPVQLARLLYFPLLSAVLMWMEYLALE